MARKTPLKLMRPGSDEPVAPAHLGAEGKALWTSIQGDYAISDPGGLILLATAAESCRPRRVLPQATG